MFTLARSVIAVAMAATSLSIAAQTVRIRGSIERVEGSSLAVTLSNGTASKLVLTPKATVVAVVKASLADIKEGSYIGSAARPQPDGSQRALEVHIFAEEMRGVGEGHRPWAPVPQSTMTNGAVAGTVVPGGDGTAIMVRYKGGEKKIVVPPDVPIVRYVISNAAELKPGARFTVIAATPKPDGSYEAARINVGRDGVVPQ
jgi:hypothetical protein